MNAEVKWIDGFKFLGTSQSGNNVVMDASGEKTAPSPMEMLLLAAGGCSSVDVINGLKEAEQTVINCVAKISTERRDTAPRIFTSLNIHFEVTGENLDEELVKKVTTDSLEKYCSVCVMLGEGIKMTHSWDVINK